ncbi:MULTISPECIES: Cu(I)-responsive transcriptional regulator [unclassified Avibacterium]|uniref:Cu(I)-responsive transcriptional regulator n=1 Tax=unclassified Avibacterium TaxID=2685287 RepID=UPI002026F86A|nr:MULTISPECIES: Cu(I)-responsive transcriptional regulator [unclassified Avibacterium]MCW9698644.1 Cu(I)-responsive transcriptional regulator [Avibacterium sp. 20-129]MCW9717285.1 Cu(I)-responsive transcriptional regulator [Avibacterium sp. 21-599]MCW9732456.1 Cu(I)-responsive transcriptional regulator [Avibacterium sp. 20-15]URL04615.1 Cu(I)-responsive transcriptional regulator [Avibacterium sp. 20-132]URL07129.1 Cu(I)-responsive transcriptional regulator [Avibacterium sp. 21-595]
MNISQAAEKTGLSAKQIRDYEKAGLLPEAQRTLSGYRFYSEQDLNQLRFISNARKVGFSLQQIRELLRLNRDPNRTSREVKAITEQHIIELKEKIASLQEMLDLLQRWHCSCQGNDSPDCSILSGLTEKTVL